VLLGGEKASVSGRVGRDCSGAFLYTQYGFSGMCPYAIFWSFFWSFFRAYTRQTKYFSFLLLILLFVLLLLLLLVFDFQLSTSH
jgi:hypothetical protein